MSCRVLELKVFVRRVQLALFKSERAKTKAESASTMRGQRSIQPPAGAGGNLCGATIDGVQRRRLTELDIAGAVASMTEDELDVLSEELPTTSLVDRDSTPRRARCLDVQSDVGCDMRLQQFMLGRVGS